MNTDILHGILNYLDHNRYTVICLILFAMALGGVVGIVGCESRTASLTPSAAGQTVQVNRSEFSREAATAEKDLAVKKTQIDAQLSAYNEEVKAFNARVQTGQADLDRQDQIRADIVNTVGLVASQAANSTLNPVSLLPIGIGLLGTALGIGTAADNRRKDTVIADLKSTTGSTTAAAPTA